MSRWSSSQAACRCASASSRSPRTFSPCSVLRSRSASGSTMRRRRRLAFGAVGAENVELLRDSALRLVITRARGLDLLGARFQPLGGRPLVQDIAERGDGGLVEGPVGEPLLELTRREALVVDLARQRPAFQHRGFGRPVAGRGDRDPVVGPVVGDRGDVVPRRSTRRPTPGGFRRSRRPVRHGRSRRARCAASRGAARAPARHGRGARGR